MTDNLATLTFHHPIREDHWGALAELLEHAARKLRAGQYHSVDEWVFGEPGVIDGV